MPVIGIGIASGTEVPRTELANREYFHPVAETEARAEHEHAAGRSSYPSQAASVPWVFREWAEVP